MADTSVWTPPDGDEVQSWTPPASDVIDPHPIRGSLQAAGSLISGMVAPLGGGLTYLGTLAATGGDTEAAKAVKDATEDSLTYTPSDYEGRESVGKIGAAIKPIADYVTRKADEVGEGAAEQTGSPLVGAAERTGLSALALAVGGGNLAKEGSAETAAARAAKLERRTAAVGEATAPEGSPLSPDAARAQATLDTATAQAQPKAAPAPSAAPAAAPAAPEAPKSPQLSQAGPELQSAIADKVNKAGADVDPETVRRHIEADNLPVKVSLTEGQATQDPALISEEMNSRRQNPEIADRFNEQNEALKDNLEHIRTQVAPDVATTDPTAHGDTLIGSYKKVDAASVADINTKYQALRDAAGGDFPVDTSALLGNVRGALQKDLLTDHAPPSIMKVLDQSAADGKMPYESYEALRTNLAAIQRDSTQSGLTRRAAGVIRDQIEQLPMTGAASDLKPLADAARSAAKARFKAIEADPAYKAVVEGDAKPDTFVDKYVINGDRDNVALMKKTLARDPQAIQTMGAATVDHLQGKALGQTGNFSQSPYNRALQGLAPKLQHLVPGEQAGQLKAVGNVARNVQAQPRGSFVNNSNTLVGSVRKGAGALAGEIPVVGKGAAKLLDERARAARVKQALEPGAGIGRKVEPTETPEPPKPTGGGAPKPSSPGVASATKPLGATIRGGNERGAVGDLRKQRGFLRSTEPTTNNASGESSASVEAQNRVAQEKANGQNRYLLDPDANPTPLTGVDSVDARAPQGHLIVQRGVGASHYTILDRGGLPQGQAQGLLARAVGLGKLDNRPLGARLPGQRGAVGVLNKDASALSRTVDPAKPAEAEAASQSLTDAHAKAAKSVVASNELRGARTDVIAKLKEDADKAADPAKSMSAPIDTSTPGKSPTMQLADAFDKALTKHNDLPMKEKVANSKAARASVRQYVKGDLITQNGKLMKNSGENVQTWGLALSPDYVEGRFMACPNSGACRDLCLGYTSGQFHAGGGGIDLTSFQGPRRAALNRTFAMLHDPEAFAVRLNDEITAAKHKAAADGDKLGLRLNVLSDLNPRIYQELIKAHPDVQFYDYTKMPYQPVAENHHYTRSSTGVSQPAGVSGNDTDVFNPHQNWTGKGGMRARLDAGDNVAMAFTHNRHLPTTLHDAETGKTYTVVNGDEHDFRPLDKQPEGQPGVIIGLKNKKVAGAKMSSHVDSNGFFVHYDPKEQRTPKGTLVRDANGDTTATNKTITIAHQYGGMRPMTDNDLKQLAEKK